MIPQISVQQLADKLAAGEPVYLLDVRQPEEHAVAALPGSTLIPLGELPGRVGEVEPPAGALVVVYCHHGVRSLTGAHMLQRAGVGPVASLAGGIDAWSRQIDPSMPRY
ncbi:MAG TPA: rhodanese-like domain-containing protein [Gemmataceae bacterium]